MDMQVSAISWDAVRVVLDGRLDIAGSAKIDIPFNVAAGTNRHVIVDMSAVTFIASIGIRTLVIGAKTVQRRGGKLLLLSPQPDVEQVLETIGVTDLLPIVRDEAEAITAIRS
ncbi:STAS domain-containing protein [Acidocella sp.]|jgi:anti-anti-sigma factor|uniref:STAS domain-containing protein n=1 Tax=Acidocella sp. TaxID=50710 RepID=UPI002F3E9573